MLPERRGGFQGKDPETWTQEAGRKRTSAFQPGVHAHPGAQSEVFFFHVVSWEAPGGLLHWNRPQKGLGWGWEPLQEAVGEVGPTPPGRTSSDRDGRGPREAGWTGTRAEKVRSAERLVGYISGVSEHLGKLSQQRCSNSRPTEQLRQSGGFTGRAHPGDKSSAGGAEAVTTQPD